MKTDARKKRNKETDAKYFRGYKTGKKIRLLFMKVSRKKIRYPNKVEKTNCKSFLFKVQKLLEKYELMWNRISNST